VLGGRALCYRPSVMARHAAIGALLALAFCPALATAAGAIYPSDHFDYATKLTPDTFGNKVKESVDAGKTLFVRFIASPQ